MSELGVFSENANVLWGEFIFVFALKFFLEYLRETSLVLWRHKSGGEKRLALI